MFQLDFDMSEFEKRAKSLGAAADQLPYIMARTMNDAVEDTRSFIIGPFWSSKVQVRNRSFLQAALTTQGKRATKTNLSVELYDRLHRAHLETHAKGGSKTGRGRIAIPARTIKKTAKGVRANDKPRATGMIRKGDALYRAVGGKKSKRLRYMYTLKPSVQIKKDVPFHETFAEQMRKGLLANLQKNINLAMSTRRA